jgi:hypothetical protein
MTSVYGGTDAESPAAWNEQVEVHWFLALPEQIAIPEEPENPLSVSFPEEGEVPGDPVMVVLLTPHHRLYPWPTPDATDAAVAVMKEVLPPALASIAHEAAATDRPLELAVTVMQAVVAYPPGELPDARRIEVGFDRALDAIAMVQRGYHAATKRPVTIRQGKSPLRSCAC